MNIETIIFCNSFGIILLIMLLESGHLFSKIGNLENRLFLVMVLDAIAGSIFEMISFIINGQDFYGARELNIALNTLVYLAIIIYPVVWAVFVDWRIYQNKERIKRTAIWASIPAFIMVGALMGNIAGEYFFAVSEDNIYSRGPFVVSILALPFLYYIFSLVEAQLGRKEMKCLFFSASMLVIPAVLGEIVQLMFYGVSIFWPCLAIGLMAVYISKQKEVSYTDSLSHIYNRKYMTYILEQKQLFRNSCAGIMIDVDQFKRINDKYGHLMGDQAITDTGTIIREAIPKKAIATRFAGDEFVILLPTDRIIEVLDVIDEINYKVKKFNSLGHRPYKLSYSIGYSVYVPGQNTIDEFLNEMDRDMYIAKKQKKICDWHTA